MSAGSASSVLSGTKSIRTDRLCGWNVSAISPAREACCRSQGAASPRALRGSVVTTPAAASTRLRVKPRSISVSRAASKASARRAVLLLLPWFEGYVVTCGGVDADRKATAVLIARSVAGVLADGSRR